MSRLLLKIWEWLRRCSYLIRRADFDEQIKEEARSHIEIRSAELQSFGLSPSESDTQARREFGPLLRMQEDSRGVWQFRYLEEMASDIRYGLRQLRNSPGFTVTAVISLALGMAPTRPSFR
jgi:hypothetical protein